MTIDEVHELLDELSSELPEEIFKELNGGVNLLPNLKRSPHGHGLLVMGDYNRGGPMGRYINIYYGSMQRVHGGLDREQYKRELRKVLRHEFRHHIESLAGERALEIEDEEFIEGYLVHDDNQACP